LERGSEPGFVPPRVSSPGDAASGGGKQARAAPLAAGNLEKLVRSISARAASDVADLVNLQSRIIRRYFRLQQIERKLLERARQKRPDSGRKTMEQVELERQRLGRELHTGIGQMLAATRLQLEVIDAQMPSPPPAVRQALDRISALASQALDQIRSVSHRLHPPEWQRLPLAEAIRQLWDLSGLPQRLEAALSIAPDLEDPELEGKIFLYRAAQEALSNIRHSHATAVSLSLSAHGHRLLLSVRDNGRGFDAAAMLSAPASLGRGLGLRSLREHAAAIGADFAVRSGPGGTTLEASVLIPEPTTSSG